MREASVVDYLRKRIKALGGETRKIRFIGHNHAPDELILLDGHGPTMAECKAPGKKPGPGQVREHERLRRFGFTVLVIDTHELVDAHFPLPTK